MKSIKITFIWSVALAVLAGCGVRELEDKSRGTLSFQFQGSSHALTNDGGTCFAVFITYPPGGKVGGICTTSDSNTLEVGERAGFVAMGEPLEAEVLVGDNRKVTILAYDGTNYSDPDGNSGCVGFDQYHPESSGSYPYIVGTKMANILPGENVVTINVDLMSSTSIENCTEIFAGGSTGGSQNCQGGDPMITTWTTASAAETITLPLTGTGTYNFTVDWGDGTAPDNITSYLDPAVTHTYTTPGTYTVSMHGQASEWSFGGSGDVAKINTVESLGDMAWINLAGAFHGAVNMTSFNVGCGVTNSVIDMSSMFQGASSVNPNLTNLDTSSVTNMRSMFQDASIANPDVTGFDTGSVINMASMFRNATVADPVVNTWSTSLVTDMSNMFNGAINANPDVSLWAVSNVLNMSFMFANTNTANPDVSAWNTSSVTNMSALFMNATSANPNVSGWDFANITSFSNMFNGASLANPDFNGVDLSGVSNFSGAFTGSALSTLNYSALLDNLASSNSNSPVVLNADATFLGTAALSRATLVALSWTITDGGQAPGVFAFSNVALTEDGVLNDGTVSTPIMVTLTNDEFTGINGDDFIIGGEVTVANLPSGLTATAIRISANQVDITLTGTAISHGSVDNISNFTVTFTNASVVSGNASVHTNNSRSDITIDFID